MRRPTPRAREISTLLKEGHPDAQRRLLEAWADPDFEDRGWAAYVFANQADAAGNPDDALRWYEVAAANHYPAYAAMVDYADRHNRPDVAEYVLRWWAVSEPSVREFELCELALERGLTELVAVRLPKLTGLSYDDASGRRQVARLYERIGLIEEAGQAWEAAATATRFEEFEELNPRADAAWEWGTAMLRHSRPDDALRAFDLIVDYAQNHTYEAGYQLALLLREQADVDPADLHRAWRYGRHAADRTEGSHAKVECARLSAAEGDLESAVADYSKAVADADPQWAPVAERELAALRAADPHAPDYQPRASDLLQSDPDRAYRMFVEEGLAGRGVQAANALWNAHHLAMRQQRFGSAVSLAQTAILSYGDDETGPDQWEKLAYTLYRSGWFEHALDACRAGREQSLRIRALEVDVLRALWRDEEAAAVEQAREADVRDWGADDADRTVELTDQGEGFVGARAAYRADGQAELASAGRSLLPIDDLVRDAPVPPREAGVLRLPPGSAPAGRPGEVTGRQPPMPLDERVQERHRELWQLRRPG